MRSIPGSYEEIAAEVVAAADIVLEERAASEREAELDRELDGHPIDIGGAPYAVRFRGDIAILAAPGAPHRALRLLSPEAEPLLAAIGIAAPHAAAALEDLRRARDRVRLLRERERLRESLREVSRRRDALQRLSEGEVRAAERARRRLLARQRMRGEPAAADAERTVPEIVLASARALSQETRRLRAALAVCERSIMQAPPARRAEGDALLRDLRTLARLIPDRITIEYRRIEREMLAGFRAVSFGEEAVDAAGATPDPADERTTQRRFLERLAFLMAKANFSLIPREDLERGFEIGPAPGVRLFVPLDGFDDAYFFARGPKLEPLLHTARGAGGVLVPRFEKFAFCLLKKPVATRRPRAPRRRARGLSRLLRKISVNLGRRARRVLAPRVGEVIEYARRLAKQPPPEIAVDPPLAIKLFRDVRLGECGLVLPGAAIRYRWRDLVLVALGAVGGIWSKIPTQPIANLLSPKLALPIFLLSGFRGVMGMRRSRLTLDKLREEYENRHLQATRMNAVAYFLREAAETDAKETLLCYAAAVFENLDRRGVPDPTGRSAGASDWKMRPRALLGRVETFLWARFRAAVDFDIADAIGSLEGTGLIPRPGFLAPGANAPDYFDDRLIGESFQEDAELLLSRESASDTSARDPARRAQPRTPEDWLRERAAHGEKDRERRDADRPFRGCDPISGAPSWFPADHESHEDARFPGDQLDVLPLPAAVARVRADMRRRLGLEDADAGEGDAMFAGRFAI